MPGTGNLRVSLADDPLRYAFSRFGFTPLRC